MDPTLISAGVSLLGSALGKPKVKASSATATSWTTTEAVFDNSGWNIAFPDSHISSEASKSTDMNAATGSGSSADLYQYFVLAAVFLIGWRAMRKV